MKEIFWSDAENRLRSGYRILIFLIGLVLLISVAGLLRLAFGKNLITSLIGLSYIAVITFTALWLAGRHVDHRSIKEYGFNISRKWWKDFGFGSALGAFLFTIVFLIERAFKWVCIIEFFKNEKDTLVNLPFTPALIIGLFAFTIMILWEEIFFRGNLMKNLSEGFNNKRLGAKGAVVLAFVLSSLFFGLIHAGNSNITIIGVANIVMLGILLGLPYLLTGELAISLALHASWNFFQGFIFGFPVSGEPSEVAVFAISQSGPELWTGGAFGPEGGLIGLIAMLVGCAFVILWIRISRGRISLHTPLAEYKKGESTAHHSFPRQK